MRCERPRRAALILSWALAACGPAVERDWETGCATCHEDQAASHRASRHAGAAASPVFRALLARQAPAAQAFCRRCHQPDGQEGLDCGTCHAAVGNTAEQNGALVWDREGPVLARSDGKAAPHAVRASGLLESAELCGTCHELVHGALAERPLTHWRASPAAAREETCQRCHLPTVEGRRARGVTPGPITGHRPRGLLGEEALPLLASAVELTAAQGPAGRVVRLAHVAGGHAFPDGASWTRALSLLVGEEETSLGLFLFAGAEESFDPVRADRAEERALGPGEVLERPLPPGARACLLFQRVRPALLRALDLPPALAGEAEVVACVE